MIKNKEDLLKLLQHPFNVNASQAKKTELIKIKVSICISSTPYLTSSLFPLFSPSSSSTSHSPRHPFPYDPTPIFLFRFHITFFSFTSPHIFTLFPPLRRLFHLLSTHASIQSFSSIFSFTQSCSSSFTLLFS